MLAVAHEELRGCGLSNNKVCFVLLTCQLPGVAHLSRPASA